MPPTLHSPFSASFQIVFCLSGCVRCLYLYGLLVSVFLRSFVSFLRFKEDSVFSDYIIFFFSFSFITYDASLISSAKFLHENALSFLLFFLRLQISLTIFRSYNFPSPDFPQHSFSILYTFTPLLRAPTRGVPHPPHIFLFFIRDFVPMFFLVSAFSFPHSLTSSLRLADRESRINLVAQENIQ